MPTKARKRRKDITTIQVSLDTRSQLDKMMDKHKDTYESIVRRLIHFYNDNNTETVQINLPLELVEQMRQLQRENRVDKLTKMIEIIRT